MDGKEGKEGIPHPGGRVPHVRITAGNHARKHSARLMRTSAPHPRFRNTATGGRNTASRYRHMSLCWGHGAFSLVMAWTGDFFGLGGGYYRSVGVGV